MNKKLYRAAFISSPILALLTTTPIYIVDNLQFPLVLWLWLLMMLLIFLIWCLNIFIISKIKDTNSYKRYVLSYVSVLVLQGSNIFMVKALHLAIRSVPDFFPFIPAVALNTLIIIIANSIIFQFQKESAELEIEQLKVINLEAQKLVLLQQLQPHFLFNALSTLKSLITENPVNAEDYTVRLSDFLRYSIQAKDNEVVSLADELKFTKDYIELQKVRFGNALSCQIELPEAILSKKVPVYALQTLVENAIKHNAFTDKKPLLIHISTEENRIKVVNNRLPKTLHVPSGTGLQNLNQRYQLIADMDIQIEETDTHFTVFITLIEK
jgi:two-component system, LytTR family, sensor kinase